MSNAMRFAACPIAGGGTPAAAWAGIACPVLDLTDCPELIVVAPHPDDETLGFGATSAALARRGVRVQVVSVTDGGAAYPGCSPRQRRCLQQRRRRELECAVETLGLPAPIHLDLPDGDVAGCRSELADRLADLLAGSPDGTWCAVTWRGDGHPDHEAAGWAAAEATARTGTVLLEYPLWMWHWAEPGDDAVPWSRMQQARHQAWAKDRKVRAIGCYASQLDSPDGDAVLPPFVVDRLLRVGGGLPVSRPLSDAYFERLYEQSDDPWELAGRWYEARKYAITMALLPSPRYRHAFEPGCSVGVLTDALTARCDHVTAGDVASRALEATDHRLAASGRRNRVTLLKSSLDEPWPVGPFDLVVFSEICYYFEAEQLRKILDDSRSRLAEGAHVVAAHWRHPVSDYPITGDQANAVIAATAGWFHLGGYRDEDVVIDVFDTGSGESVAVRTNVPRG